MIITRETLEKMILSDKLIRNKAIGESVMEGLQPCGIDVTLSRQYKVRNEITDVQSLYYKDLIEQQDQLYTDQEGDAILVPKRGFVLAITEHEIHMPKSAMGLFMCRSVFARMGINMPPTIINAGWTGKLVVEIHNTNPYDIALPTEASKDAVGQIVFLTCDHEVEYKGNYQDQSKIRI